MARKKTVTTQPGRPAPVQVTMRRAEVDPTPDQALWGVISNSADALGFDNYVAFIEPIMCGERAATRAEPGSTTSSAKLRLPFPDAEPYRLLKVATEVFMMAQRRRGVSARTRTEPGHDATIRGSGCDSAGLPPTAARPIPRVNADEEQLQAARARLTRSRRRSPSRVGSST